MIGIGIADGFYFGIGTAIAYAVIGIGALIVAAIVGALGR